MSPLYRRHPTPEAAAHKLRALRRHFSVMQPGMPGRLRRILIMEPKEKSR